MVGTSILVPSPASSMRTGMVISISSPSRRNNGCGSTRMVMYRSPEGAPCVPAFPFPATRNRDPCCAPGGMRTSTASLFEIRPSPWHVEHLLRKRPVPSHLGHVRLNFIAPAVCVTLPLPLHSGQPAFAPGREPVPLHVGHVSWRVMLSRTCVPLMACQKSMLNPYSRSAPVSGGAVLASAALPPPNHWLKIS